MTTCYCHGPDEPHEAGESDWCCADDEETCLLQELSDQDEAAKWNFNRDRARDVNRGRG
jgi:hypothetical protein